MLPRCCGQQLLAPGAGRVPRRKKAAPSLASECTNKARLFYDPRCWSALCLPGSPEGCAVERGWGWGCLAGSAALLGRYGAPARGAAAVRGAAGAHPGTSLPLSWPRAAESMPVLSPRGLAGAGPVAARGWSRPGAPLTCVVFWLQGVTAGPFAPGAAPEVAPDAVPDHFAGAAERPAPSYSNMEEVD